MNPSKRIQNSVGKQVAERKAPTNKIGGGKVDMSKGGAMKAAKMSVGSASFNHTAKMHKTPDWKGSNNK